jgi:transcription elongation factor Elf1
MLGNLIHGPSNKKFNQYYCIFSSIVIIISSFFVFGILNTPTVVSMRIAESEPNDNFGNATLLMNQEVSGSVSDLDEFDYYKVTLTSGQTVAIELTPNLSGTANITFALFNKDSDELKRIESILPDQTIFYNYTVNQTPNSPYYIELQAQGVGNLYDLRTTITSQNDADSGDDAPDDAVTAKELYGGKIDGFLAVMDVSDFYWFKVNAGRVIDFNFTVKPNNDPMNFMIYNNTQGNAIKTFTDISAGSFRTFQYTTDGNGSRVYYIEANIDYNQRSEYSIDLNINPQEDGEGYTDAADNFTEPSPLTVKGEYTGWLGGGNLGLDHVDIYEITVPKGNHTFYLNITPNASLDIVIYLFDANFKSIKSLNPGPGEMIKFKRVFNITNKTKVYPKLEIPKGQTSKGEYKIEFSFTVNKPPNADTDNDQMPDIWEKEYSLNPDSAADANNDPDADGFSNLEEYQGGTDPTDPSSFPEKTIDYSHLTAAACLRAYSDKKHDVFHWSGSYDDDAELVEITKAEIVSGSSYDLVNLESARVDDDLVVKLKVAGKVENLGNLEDINSEVDSTISSGTFYNVFFVKTSFSEVMINSENLPQFVESEDLLIQGSLNYLNKTYFGPNETTGAILEDGKVISWKVPLKEIAELPANFELYAFVYHFDLTPAQTSRGTEDIDYGSGTRASKPFQAYADSIGTGSELQETRMKIKKTIEIDQREVSVTVETEGTGGILLLTEKPDPPTARIPSNVASLGVYFEVTLIGVDGESEIFITTSYKNSDIPLGYKEKDIRLFYLDIDKGLWVKITDSGVWTGNDTVYAQLDHLTIFAPMVEKESDEPSSESGSDWLFIIMIIVIIIVVLVIVILFFVIRSKKQKATPLGPEPPRHRRALKPEFFECPKCGVEIEIPYSEDEDVTLECYECGARGRIENPYLGTAGEEYDEDRHRGYGDYEDNRYDEDYDSGRDYDHDRDRQPYSKKVYDARPGRGDADLEYTPPRSRQKRQKVDRYDYDEDYEYDEHSYDYEDEYDHYERTRDRDTRRRERGRRPDKKLRERDREHRKEPVRRRKRDEPEERERAADYDEDDYEYKECPKCGGDIPIPYEEDEKVLLKCPNCGARGKVKNPYLQ